MPSRRNRLSPSCAATAVLALGLWISACAFAGTFERRFEEGNTLLRNGDATGALELYRELHIDRPESERVAFAIGCAQFDLGKTGAQPDGLNQARQTFERFDRSNHPEIRKRAVYNLANTQTLLARQSASNMDRDAAVGMLEECIRAYETVLEQHPGYGPAEHNRDHVRYLLKRMLQEPPSQASQDSDQDEDGQESGDRQQKQDSAQDPSEQEPNEQRPESQATPGDQDTPADEKQSAQHTDPTDSKTRARDRKTVEAILQSLEDRDRLEQRERRRGPVDSQPTREWW